MPCKILHTHKQTNTEAKVQTNTRAFCLFLVSTLMNDDDDDDAADDVADDAGADADAFTNRIHR